MKSNSFKEKINELIKNPENKEYFKDIKKEQII